MPPAAPRPASGFTAVNRTEVVAFPVEPPTARDHETQTSPAKSMSMMPTSSATPPTSKGSDLAMRYRGKLWHFKSVAHKAKVLEMLILQEERDVDTYPMKAFSKPRGKAGYGEDTGTIGALEDHFRFYTHFMTERFPANEKTLLENGVHPSA
jgi:hypothetical protein